MNKTKLEKMITVSLFMILGCVFSLKCILAGQRPKERLPEVSYDQTKNGEVLVGAADQFCSSRCKCSTRI